MVFDVKRQGRVIGVYPEIRELMLTHNQHPQLVHTSNLIAKCKAKNFSALPVYFAILDGNKVEEFVTTIVFSGKVGASFL